MILGRLRQGRKRRSRLILRQHLTRKVWTWWSSEDKWRTENLNYIVRSSIVEKLAAEQQQQIIRYWSYKAFKKTNIDIKPSERMKRMKLFKRILGKITVAKQAENIWRQNVKIKYLWWTYCLDPQLKCLAGSKFN